MHRLLVSALLLAWWIVVMQGWLPTAGEADLSTALTSTDEGSTRNALQIGVIALLGFVYLCTSYQLLLTPGTRLVTLLFGAYLVWSLITFLWSDDLGLSIRRYVQLALVVAGAVGVGLGFYGTQPDGLRLLFKHVTVAAIVAQLVLWVPLLVSGDVHLFDPAWSVKDIVGSPIGFPTAFALVFAVSWFGRKNSWQKNLRVVVFVAACALTIFAQKMRMVILALCFVALVALARWLAGRPRLCLVVCSAALLLLVGILEVSVLFGDFTGPAREVLWAFATLDASANDTGTLTGRVPLWDVLWAALQEQPIVGHGFGAFWSSTRIEQVYNDARWPAVTAHNGYLDEALATGAIGLVLLLAAWLAAMWKALRLARDRVEPQALVVFVWLGLFLLFNTAGSIMQWFFQFPFYVSLVGLATLIGLQAARRTGRG